MQLLAVFRLFQALGACGGAVMSRAMVRDLFPPEDLRRIFSMLVLVIGVSPLVAPLIGGYLLLWFGWQSIFWLHTLLAAAALLGVYFRLPETLAPELCLTTQWLLGYETVWSDAAGMHFIIHHMV